MNEQVRGKKERQGEGEGRGGEQTYEWMVGVEWEGSLDHEG